MRRIISHFMLIHAVISDPDDHQCQLYISVKVKKNTPVRRFLQLPQLFSSGAARPYWSALTFNQNTLRLVGQQLRPNRCLSSCSKSNMRPFLPPDPSFIHHSARVEISSQKSLCHPICTGNTLADLLSLMLQSLPTDQKVLLFLFSMMVSVAVWWLGRLHRKKVPGLHRDGNEL